MSKGNQSRLSEGASREAVMSRAKILSFSPLAEVADVVPADQAAHLERAAAAVERILLSAYDQRHDDATRVLADILERLREASAAITTA